MSITEGTVSEMGSLIREPTEATVLEKKDLWTLLTGVSKKESSALWDRTSEKWNGDAGSPEEATQGAGLFPLLGLRLQHEPRR